MSPRLATIADALIAKSNGRYDDEFLRILVANVANEFEGAHVQDYIEVLVVKRAADELRRLQGLRQISQ